MGTTALDAIQDIFPDRETIAANSERTGLSTCAVQQTLLIENIKNTLYSGIDDDNDPLSTEQIAYLLAYALDMIRPTPREFK